MKVHVGHVPWLQNAKETIETVDVMVQAKSKVG